MISKKQCCAAKLVKSATYTGSVFFREQMKIMLVMTNHEIMLSQSRSIKALLGRKEFARDTSHLFQNLFFPYSMILKELTL